MVKKAPKWLQPDPTTIFVLLAKVGALEKAHSTHSEAQWIIQYAEIHT